MSVLNLGFLASHGGSNMQAIIDGTLRGELDANLCALISNNSESQALVRAANVGMPAFHISEATHPGKVTEAIIDTFKMQGVDIIVLAGYMKFLDPRVIESFSGRVLNIHPALLPKFGGQGMYGMNVHKAVLANGETVSGPTVHLVDSQYDRGRILAQKQVSVEPNDTADTLAARVLAAEHFIYLDTLKRISAGEIKI